MSRVLIVEDDEGFRSLLKEILTEEGFLVETAQDGKEGIEEIRRTPPDILFTGLIMPKISGERLIDYVRKDPALKEIHIVMISGALKEYPNYHRLGADHYVEKCDIPTLIKKIQFVCRQILSREDRSERPVPTFPQGARLRHRKIVEELLINRQQSNQIVVSMREGLVIYDFDHKIIESNPATERFFGKPPTSLLTTPIEDHFEGPLKEKITRILSQLSKKEKEEGSLIVSIGDRTFDLRFMNFTDDNTEISRGGLLLIYDLTQQKKAEDDLQRERNYYLGIMESLNEGIVVLNRDLTIQSINQFLLFFLNKDLNEVLGQKCHSLFFDEKDPCPDCYITESRIFERGRNFYVKRIYRNFEGAPFSFEISGTPLQIKDEVITSILLTFSDVTVREKLSGHLEAMARIVSLILKGEPLKEKMSEVLGIIGKASRASRCYWFENHQDPHGRVLASPRAEWCAEGIEPHSNNPKLQNLNYEDYPRWHAVLSSKGILTGAVAGCPGKERSLLDSQGIRAILVAPLFIRDHFSGFMGLDNCMSDSPWPDADLNLLRSAADS
ncbi:MAG: response regulator, partial [Pseudomonadota bacterium]